MLSLLSFGFVMLAVGACGEVEPASAVTTTTLAAPPGTTAATDPTASTSPAPPAPPLTTMTGVTTTTVTRHETTTAPAESAVVLRSDGLGSLDFGTPTETAVQVLTEVLGSPSPGEAYPYGGHPLRLMYWDQWGLSVTFSDYDFYRSDGIEHLAGWGLGPKPTGEPAVPGASWTLKTAEGIGIGFSLAAIEAVYGDSLVMEEAPCDGPPQSAYVPGPGPDDRGFRLFMYFDRLTSDPAARVVALGAGAGPGC